MISIDWQGLDAAVIRIDSLGDTASMTSLLEFIGEKSRGQFVNYFRREAGPNGAWKPLSPATVARRRKGSSRILQDTGRLMGSIDFIAAFPSVEIGTNVFYGKFHQYGGRGGTRPPVREFLGWGEPERDALQRAIEHFLRARWGAA